VTKAVVRAADFISVIQQARNVLATVSPLKPHYCKVVVSVVLLGCSDHLYAHHMQPEQQWCTQQQQQTSAMTVLTAVETIELLV
jgi:hypothetical protein